MPQVTSSVVSHGQGHLLGTLLSDLDRLANPDLTHLVVTLNLAEDWAPPTRVGHATVTVIRNEWPLGFAANHNQAFRQCSTPVFVVLNPDLRLPHDPLPALQQALREPGCALAVPWQLDEAGAPENFCRELMTPWKLLQRTVSRRRGRALGLTPPERLDWVAGSFLCVDAAAFRAIGGFDPGYRLYCEDADLCLRLQLAGGRIAVLRDTVIVHAAQRHSGGHLKYLGWHVASLARHWTSRAFWRYWRAHRHG